MLWIKNGIDSSHARSGIPLHHNMMDRISDTKLKMRTTFRRRSHRAGNRQFGMLQRNREFILWSFSLITAEEAGEAPHSFAPILPAMDTWSLRWIIPKL
jgi:hypothetical protein